MGSKDEFWGNQTCQVTGYRVVGTTQATTLQVDLKIRIPECVLGVTEYVPVTVEFEHAAALQSVLQRLTASGGFGHGIAWRFIIDRTRQRIYVYASVTEDVPPLQMVPEAVLGIDFNENFFTVAVVARKGKHAGNRIWHWTDHFRGKSAQQTKDNINKIIKNYCALAKVMHWAIVIEDLDFAVKKTKNLGKRFNKMLSQWLTAHFAETVQRNAAREGVYTFAVNPAYTSLIGDYKFSGYGYSRHEKAAITIARRGLGWSERLRCKNPDTDKLLVKKVCHHVWSAWAKVQVLGVVKIQNKVGVTKGTTVTHPVGRGCLGSVTNLNHSPSSGP